MKIILKHVRTYSGEFDTDDVIIGRMAMERAFFHEKDSLTVDTDEISTYADNGDEISKADMIIMSLPELETLSGQALQQARDIINDIING